MINEPRSIVLVRCVKIDGQARRIADEMRDALNTPVFFIQDNLSHDSSTTSPSDATFSLTKANLDNLNLFHEREKIGWLCGDYGLYLALELNWEYAWIVETDVAIIGSAHETLRTVDASDSDLICTAYAKASKNWHPYERIKHLAPEIDVYSMSFPLERVSRRLAVECLQFRQSITQDLKDNPTLRVPNDESVVASIAHARNFSVTDIKEQFPEVFRHWYTTLRFPLPDVYTTTGEGHYIIHSAVGEHRFLYNIEFQWNRVLRGETSFEKSLKSSLELCTAETLDKALTRIHETTARFITEQLGSRN